jgi:hypothetical protein
MTSEAIGNSTVNARIVGNTVPATISIVVRFYYFLLPLHVSVPV